MTKQMEWADFFNGHAPEYEGNIFTKNTLAEIDFLVDVLNIEPGQSVLDVGCGTGRHSIELARRGFGVTGLDATVGPGALADVTQHVPQQSRIAIPRTSVGARPGEGDTRQAVGLDVPVGQPFAALPRGAVDVRVFAACQHRVHAVPPDRIEQRFVARERPDDVERVQAVDDPDAVNRDILSQLSQQSFERKGALHNLRDVVINDFQYEENSDEFQLIMQCMERPDEVTCICRDYARSKNLQITE